MARLLAVCAVSLLTIAPSAPAAFDPQGGPVHRTVLVTVIPESGGPVRTLTAADFKLKEGGTERQIVDAALATEPLFVSMLVESAQGENYSNLLVQDLRQGLGAFVKSLRAAEPSAKIALTDVGGAAVVSVPFDRPAGDLDAAIEKLYPTYRGITVVVEAIGETTRILADKPTPRRAIVSIDFAPNEAANERTIKQAGDRLAASGATLWSISLRPVHMQATIRDQGLDYFSRFSGGARLLVVNSTGFEAQLKKVADALLSQYAVTFVSPYPNSGRPLEVTTSKGVKAVASRMVR